MKTRQTLDNAMPKQPTAEQLAGGLLITVGEARKLVGADTEDLSDDELIAFIYRLSEIAQASLRIPLSF